MLEVSTVFENWEYHTITKLQGPARVFVGRAGAGLIEYAFAPTSRPFGQAHVLRVSPDGEHIAVGDIDSGKSTLWLFKVSL